MKSKTWLGPIVAAALCIGATTARAATASLDRSSIAQGDAAVLRITDDGDAPRLPSVPGLIFDPSGQSTEMTVINGAVSQHTSRIYRVSAVRPGSYSIPVAGQVLHLEVGSGSAAPSSATAVPVAASPASARSSLAFLRMGIAKQKLYVGQTVPFTFKAYFQPGTEVTLTGPPSLGVPAFTLSQLADTPKQTVETIGGQPYRVAIWNGLATAAMPGRYPVNATLPVTVRYREASSQPTDPFAGMGIDDDLLGQSPLLRQFMNRSAFGGADLFAPVREREMTLRAPAQTLEVAALPPGAPPSFSGAVGQFDVHATITPHHGAAFEPLSLKIEIAGHGNFERVATEGLPADRTWKTYAAHLMPVAGSAVVSRTFEQAVVPQTSGHLTVSPIAFSYFDPDARRYVTRSTASLNVDVSAATNAAAPPSEVKPVAVADPPLAHPMTSGWLFQSLVPPYRKPWFGWLLMAPFAALAIALIAAPRAARPLSAKRRRRMTRESVARERSVMRRAAQANDATRFFSAAQTALQLELGETWSMLPENVTAAEVQARMGQSGARIVAALTSAEELRYAGRIRATASLPALDTLLENELDQLQQHQIEHRENRS